MEKINVFDNKENQLNTVIALGNFDGVHKGHQELIKKMISKGREMKLKTSVLVFENHTKEVIKGKKQDLLTSTEQRNQIIKDLGVDVLFSIVFDKSIMGLSPENFIKDILIDKLNVKGIFVGTDYRFGYKAQGDSKILKRLGKKYNIHVEIIEPLYIHDELVSSTRIRNLIKEADFKEVKRLLGRDYSIVGKIVSGKKLGRKLGFPTANIEPVTNYCLPKNGVYDTDTKVNSRNYRSASSIGFNPTFKENILKIESHLLDFTGSLYGEYIELVFHKYLREELKFSDLDSLIKQMSLDVLKVKSTRLTHEK